MINSTSKALLLESMQDIFKDLPYGIEHTLCVLHNAEEIMKGEDLSEEEISLVVTNAILHDIGAVQALKKYNSIAPEYQELEGYSVAWKILSDMNCEIDFIKRVCFVVGHHHTKDKVNGIDFQILWDADMIENLKEKTLNQSQLMDKIESDFFTDTGKRLASKMLTTVQRD